MKMGDLYRYRGIDSKGSSFDPWGKGGQCEGKIVEIQAIAQFGIYPIEISLYQQEEVDWPLLWEEADKRFAVARDELIPLTPRPLVDWM